MVSEPRPRRSFRCSSLLTTYPERYTAVQRSQHLTQGDPRVFGQSYVANCSTVDGQAAFRGEESDQRHIEYFQSLEKFREAGLPSRLPSHMEEALTRDLQLNEMKGELEMLVKQKAGIDTLTKVKKRHAAHFKALKTKALRRYQDHWVKERRDWKILTRGKGKTPDHSKSDFVQSICQLIPERARVAQAMAAEDALDQDVMWLALQDLYALCVEDFTVLYLPECRPVDGACPSRCCQQQLSRSSLSS